MRNPLVPFALLAVVTAATFALALWHPFSPTAPADAAPTSGDTARGASVFATTCAGCHGADASGGVGPALRGSGVTAAEVESVVATGRGTMPAGLVADQNLADVAAYVATLSE
jgi:mono/diheme cytochrome c family protein